MYRVTPAEIAEVQAAAAAKGRGPLEISVYLDYTATQRIDEMAEAGCDRVVVCLPTAPRTEVLEYVEQIAAAWIAPVAGVAGCRPGRCIIKVSGPVAQVG